MKKTAFVLLLLGLLLSACNELPKSLVPTTPSSAPDYFCTWNLQAYVCNSADNESMRYAMNENYIFGDGELENWIDELPEIRQDLLFVLDDSWDIPLTENGVHNNPYLGLTTLDTTRFPSFQGENGERLKALVDQIKAKGWKGAGGWICAQEAKVAQVTTPEQVVAYWTARLKESAYADFSYWKVDWGREERNEAWRRQLSELGRVHAPKVWIEHAMVDDYVAFSDVFRTYDVENVISQPVTIQRVASVLRKSKESQAKGLINCEDEPYIAAGLGCVIGVMRHRFTKAFPDGSQDFVFPPTGRDIKHRKDEVIRAVRWHRIAEPFGVSTTSLEIDEVKHDDYWVFKPRETWNYWAEGRAEGDTLRASAPSRISRGLPLPQVEGAADKSLPYLLASLHPNGAVAIAAVSRTQGRDYFTPPVAVTQQVPSLAHPIALFGRFDSLRLQLPDSIDWAQYRVLAQDLALDVAEEITSRITCEGNMITIPGEVINDVGLRGASPGDKSDPGMVVQFFRRDKP